LKPLAFVHGFRDATSARALVSRINRLAAEVEEVIFMEVCGTHTMSISRHGIRQILPNNIRLLSGPGCPVCVTPNAYLDHAIALAREGFVITTFGDMMRVPGSYSSLRKERARGADIRVVYSTLDALDMAMQEPDRRVVFLGIGFETTAPTIAAALVQARSKELKNFFVLSGAKLIPPALWILFQEDRVALHGLLCPGHVSVVLGISPYEPLAETFRMPCVIAGFEPLDILQGVMMLLEQHVACESKVEIAYRRAVNSEGNPRAQALLDQVFDVSDSEWRGFGTIPRSGLMLSEEFSSLDAKQFDVFVEATKEESNCACGEVLRGLKTPHACKLFRKVCTPEDPRGACMVSSEGTCAAAFHYDVD